MSSLASSASASVKYSEFLSSLSIALQSADSQAIIGGRQLNLHRAAVGIVSLEFYSQITVSWLKFSNVIIVSKSLAV